jgi:lipopolysaccharide export system protein LptA
MTRRMERALRRAGAVAGSALLAALLAGSPGAAQQQVGGVPFGVAGDHDPDQPVEITSDSLSVDQRANTATFRGSVVVGQGALRLAADEVEVQYGEGPEGETSVEQIRASGSVAVTSGQEAAEGEEALYRVGAGTIEMAGDVILTQGPNAISGDRLSIDLGTGVATIEGRVQTIVVPGPRPGRAPNEAPNRAPGQAPGQAPGAAQ